VPVCHVFRASLPVSAIIFAPFSRTAAISARWSWIRLSLVMINHWRSATSGIQTRSSVAGSLIGHGGRVRRWDRGARIPRISRVAPESSNDARDAKDVRVEVEAGV
jgi:hypothetical protein